MQPTRDTPRLLVWTFASALAIFAVNLFWLSPFLTRVWGPLVGNLTYLGIRIVVVIAVSGILGALWQGKSFKVFRATSILLFVDQVPLKYLWVRMEIARDPAPWQGASQSGIIYGLALSYLMFVPFLVLISFLGSQIRELLALRKRRLPVVSA